MSGVFKKIIKKIKKVFKKVVKVVKKIVSSKIFKVVVAATAIYFAAGAALGAASTGATAAGAATTTTAAAGATTVAPAAVAAVAPAAASAGSVIGAGTGLLSGATSALSGLAAGATKWAASNSLLASTALSMGGQMLAGAGEDKAAEEERDRRDKELAEAHGTRLNLYDNTMSAMQRVAGRNEMNQAGQQQAANGSSEAAPGATTLVSESYGKKRSSYYDNADNKWKQVS